MSTFHPKSYNTSVARPLSKYVAALLQKPKPPHWAITLARRKAEQHERWRVPGTPFLVGQRKVYLYVFMYKLTQNLQKLYLYECGILMKLVSPKVTMALLHTPNLSARWAQFEVPLSFNKLDMRDYLFHAYNVRIKSVRTFIPWVPVKRRMEKTKPGQRTNYRPKGIKKMTVELENPFAWPEVPEDFTKWDRERFLKMTGQSADRREQNRKKMESGWRQKGALYYADNPTTELRRQAERLLKGEERWSTTDPSTLTQNADNNNIPLR